MSFWDDLGNTASNALKDAQPAITQYATDWFKSTVLGQSQPAPQNPQPTVSMLPAPVQAVSNYASANKTTVILLALVAVASFFFFKRGK